MSKHGDPRTGSYFELVPRAPALEVQRPIPGAVDPAELERIGVIEWSEINDEPLFEADSWIDSLTIADVDAIAKALSLVDTRPKFERAIAERPVLKVVS